MNNPFSIVTLVKGRHRQLANLLHSIECSSIKPRDIVIVWMDERNEQNKAPYGKITQTELYISESGLPLAKARNLGLKSAKEDIAIFVDVDCICSPTLFESLLKRCAPQRVVSAKARYLCDVPSSGNYKALADKAVIHPKRDVLVTDVPSNFKSFWSLIFAISRDDFMSVGGFDESFTGYGAEDTDFAMKCEKREMELIYVEDYVLHQYHDKFTPPINHAQDICKNANVFAKKWGFLPMYTWLTTLSDMGFVKIDEVNKRVELMRVPCDDEIEACRSSNPF
ncbi:glycosyltransferase family 2 protein [Alteromonas oceanisediminis]|uniref:glycosyltransferase family 2 protein n=1 Tax=Alteromonas oceanisediminis TaxID=2836180 RepID=UPI001BD91AC4|nr:galactosyltransferase-related protein [Alteromonas oceanisediminis]MBT0587079.1 glycosyltransferase [Alteromonas oceanisediminis]